MEIEALILAAGVGSRLHPHTENVPKPMIEIRGKPVLEHNLELLATHGIHNVIINLHHLPEVIRSRLGSGERWGVHIEYLEEEELLGTAGTVGVIAGRATDPLLVLYGDNITGCDLTNLYEAHTASRAIATVAVHHRDDPTTSGMALIDDDGIIYGLVEKPGREDVVSNWVSAGVLLLSHEALSSILPPDVDLARDLLPRLVETGRVRAFHLTGPVVWIDTNEDLERARSGKLHQ